MYKGKVDNMHGTRYIKKKIQRVRKELTMVKRGGELVTKGRR